MAIIKSGNSTDQLTIDPISKAAHVTLYDITGAVVSPASDSTLTNGTAKFQMWDGSNVIGTIAHPVVVSSAPSADRIVTGTITASPSNVAISGQGAGTILFNVVGTWTGTLNFEASVDGTNWSPAYVLPRFPATGSAVTNTTTNGQWAINAGGLNMFRVSTSAPWTGTATITLEAGQANNISEVFQLDPSNLHVTVDALPATVAVTQSTSPWVVSGTITANAGTGTFTTEDISNGTPGSLAPVNALQVGGSDGTNLRVFSTDSTGQLKVLVQNTPTVAFATPQHVIVDSGDVGADGVVDSNNSTTTPLGAGGVFTGTATNILPYTSIRTSVFSDQDSAVNGLQFQFSEDGTNWDIISSVSVSAGDAISVPFGRQAQYFRIVYTNGATPQTAFRVQTILQSIAVQINRNFLGQAPEDTDTAQITQSVLYGHNTAGGSSYVAVKVTAGGAVSVNPPNNASTNIAQIGGTPIALGQTTMSASVPVTVASDQTPLPVSGTVTTTQGTSPWVVSGTVTEQTPQISGFFPNLGAQYSTGQIVPPVVDAAGQFAVRGAVFTDEGSFRDHFNGSSLVATLTGTVNFTNSSTNITGSGTAFTSEVQIGYWIKKSADPESDYVVVAKVISDTQLTLASPYQGTTAPSTAVAGLFASQTGSGGSITVSTSSVNISSGVSSGATTGIVAGLADYLPLVIEFYLNIDQAIANQIITFGLQDQFGSSAMEQAVIQFSGTDPTVGNFITTANGTEIESTPFNFDGGANFLGDHKYRIGLSGNRAELSIDDTVVATNSVDLPAPYTEMSPVAYIQNTGIPSGSTTISIDWIWFNDVDRLEVTNSFDEPMPFSLSGPYRTNDVAATVSPFNALNITQEASQLFSDFFGNGLDTTNRWNVGSGSGGSNPTSGGIDIRFTSLVPGTTVNGYSLLQSQALFPLLSPTHLRMTWGVVLDNPITTNSYRFWGLGNTLATPTLTTPVLDGIGWEIGIDGNLYAVLYSGNSGTSTTRSQIADLSPSGTNVQPMDGNVHIYYLWWNVGTAFWAIDRAENIVASLPNATFGPNNRTMHMTAINISNGTSGELHVDGCGLGDTARNNQAISDGQYYWRKATVKDVSTAAQTTDTSLVVALSPNTPLPAGSNAIGTVTANAGTGTFNTKDASDMTGTTPGTAPASTSIVGGVYNTVAPTFTNGQTGPFQFDVNGNLKIVATGASGGTSSNFGSAFPGIGTAIGAEYNLTPPTYTDGTMVPLQTDVNGILKVNVNSVSGTFTAASNGATGSPVPSYADYVGFNSSGNLVGVSSSNPLPISVTGTAAVTQSGNWTTRIVGNTGAVLDAAIGGSQPANMIQVGGQVTTANPTYVTATQNTFSFNTVGAVRTDHTSVAGTALTAVPSTFGSAPTGSVQGVNASIFVGTQSVPSGTFGTGPGAVAGSLPVNASLYIGTTALTTTGTAGQALVGIAGHTGVAVDGATGAAVPANALMIGGTDGTNLRALLTSTTGQLHVIADSGSTTAVTGTVTVAQATGTNLHTVLDSGTLTSITNAVTVSQATAANLNATVVGTGTFAVQAAQSGNWTSRIVGNAGATLDGTVAAGTAPTNALAILGQYNTTIPAPTAAQTVAIQVDSTGGLYVNQEGRKQTYRVGIVAFTPIASATAPTVSITGSATKTIRITRIVFSASAATGTICDIQLLRYSALTGGTPNSQAANVAKLDSNNAAQTAVVNQWSAAATTATSAGILNSKRFEIVTAAVSVQPGEIEWKFGDNNEQGLVLRGTGEFAGIRLSAVGTTPVGDCWVEWTEE